eukprot:scaffold72141_cov56-Phaeocystis_antarctica.AAC.1
MVGVQGRLTVDGVGRVGRGPAAGCGCLVREWWPRLSPGQCSPTFGRGSRPSQLCSSPAQG